MFNDFFLNIVDFEIMSLNKLKDRHKIDKGPPRPTLYHVILTGRKKVSIKRILRKDHRKLLKSR